MYVGPPTSDSAAPPPRHGPEARSLYAQVSHRLEHLPLLLVWRPDLDTVATPAAMIGGAQYAPRWPTSVLGHLTVGWFDCFAAQMWFCSTLSHA